MSSLLFLVLGYTCLIKKQTTHVLAHLNLLYILNIVTQNTLCCTKYVHKLAFMTPNFRILKNK
jgi:hypothetical protein